MSLKGKVAFITGSSKNLGRHFADVLSKDGANIVIHHHSDSSKQQANETAQLVQDNGAEYLIVQGDISKVDVIKGIFKQILDRFGKIDIVVNNAGEAIIKPLVEVSEEEYDSCFGVNTKGAFFIMQEAAKVMNENGRIINIATTILGLTRGGCSIYAGAKASLEHFTRALAHEIGHKGITVNTVAPGPVDTELFRLNSNDTATNIAMNLVPAKRLGRVDDIGPVIKFLSSEEARWITAQTIFVNGGLNAR